MESPCDQFRYYGVALLPGTLCLDDDKPPLVFTDKKEALKAIKKYKGARFKGFTKKNEAVTFASCATEQCLSPITKSPNAIRLPDLYYMIEKSSPFKAPKSQEMVRLRKAIENGDANYFKQAVWSNPRYLVSSGDTPAILQEGFRYNALHVAAKNKQPALCTLILDTIEDRKFMNLLYSDDSKDVCQQRIDFLTDLYLNMPDKGLCETPLHFASKFGYLLCVQILLSHPKCDSKRKNKYGQTAKDIICDRCPDGSLEFKKQIELVFEDRCYVTVLRSDDNSLQPVISELYSVETENDLEITKREFESESPRDPSRSVKAIAGPMSPNQAKCFYKKWKTPPRTDINNLYKIRLTDMEKGLEVVGRELAKQYDVSWKEYWSFMDCWCDLSSPEGLLKLENYLKNKQEKILSEMQADKIMENNFSSNRKNLNESSVNCLISPISNMCNMLDYIHFYKSDLVNNSNSIRHNVPSNANYYLSDIARILQYDDFDCEKDQPIKNTNQKSLNCIEKNLWNLFKENNSNSDIQDKIINKNETRSENMATKFLIQKLSTKLEEIITSDENFFHLALKGDLMESILPHIQYLSETVVQLNLDKQVDGIHSMIAKSVAENLKHNLVPHELQLLSKFIKDYLQNNHEISSEEEKENIRSKIIFKSFSKQQLHLYLNCILKFIQSFINTYSKQENEICHCSWSSSNVTANEITKSEKIKSENINIPCAENESSDDEFYTPPSSLESVESLEIRKTPEQFSIFIYGRFPSKLDMDVLKAIGNTEVDPKLYPHTYHWKNLIENFPKEESKNWPSPVKPNYKRLLSLTSYNETPVRTSTPKLKIKLISE